MNMAVKAGLFIYTMIFVLWFANKYVLTKFFFPQTQNLPRNEHEIRRKKCTTRPFCLICAHIILKPKGPIQ